MSELADNDIKWLIERNYDAYLTWIGLWLVCLLGIVNMLMIVASTPNNFLTLCHLLLLIIMNIGLLVGMGEAIKRLSNLTGNNILYARQIKSEPLRKEMTKHRGPLVRFFINYEGQIRRWNRRLAYIAHVVVVALMFYLALM